MINVWSLLFLKIFFWP